MVKLRVNPMVLAAALGLLGPAALEEEEASPGPVGLWLRTPGDAEPALPGGLGERIEVLALEDRVYIDDGRGAGLADQGSWSRLTDGSLRQELVVDSTRVLREFRAEADGLSVHTQVQHDGGLMESVARYTRLSV